MGKKFAYFAFAFLLFSCSNPYEKIDNMKWLEGEWTSVVQGNTVTESWVKTNDSTWTGQSKFIKDGEILFSEEMTITKYNQVFSFNSSSEGQNGGKSVQFVANKVSDKEVIFENLEHDFPQQIVYTKNHPDSILAYIKGNLNGRPERINFRMSKTK